MARMHRVSSPVKENVDLQQPVDFAGQGSDGLMCQQDFKLRGIPTPAVNSRPF